MYGALLKPLPYPAADRMVYISEWNSQNSDLAPSYPDFQDWRVAQDDFSHLATFRTGQVTLKTPAGSELVSSAIVSADFFPVLGVHAAVGRDV